MTTELALAGPTMTRSIASSQSIISITFLFRRAASSAASIEQVLEIGAGEARRSFGERFKRNFAAQAVCCGA